MTVHDHILAERIANKHALRRKHAAGSTQAPPQRAEPSHPAPSPQNGVSAISEPQTAFGAALRRMREQVGWSQSELGRRAGYDHSYVSRIESGGRWPTRDAVVRFAEALQLTPSDPAWTALHLAAGFSPDADADLLRDWSRLSDAGKATVRAVMAVALGEEVEA